jgi:hypothetical protein
MRTFWEWVTGVPNAMRVAPHTDDTPRPISPEDCSHAYVQERSVTVEHRGVFGTKVSDYYEGRCVDCGEIRWTR